MNVTAQKKSNLRATQKSILIAICLIDRSRETILKKSCCVYIKMRDRSAVFEYLPTGTGSCHQWDLAISQLWNKFEKPDLTTPSKIRAEKLVIPVKLRRANCSQSQILSSGPGDDIKHECVQHQITGRKLQNANSTNKTSSQLRPVFRASCHHLRTIAKEHSFCNLRAHRVYCSSYRQSIPAAPRERIISPRKVTN